MKKLLPKSFKNPAGFTLIELMIVVAIIAVLSVIGITIFGNIQQRGRDARRKGDIDAITKALEAHYNDAACGASATSPYCPVTSTTAASLFSSGVTPVNPTPGGAGYTGLPTAAAATYSICATLEISDPAVGGTSYCRKNQQ